MAGHGLTDEPGPPRLSNQTRPYTLKSNAPLHSCASLSTIQKAPTPYCLESPSPRGPFYIFAIITNDRHSKAILRIALTYLPLLFENTFKFTFFADVARQHGCFVLSSRKKKQRLERETCRRWKATSGGCRRRYPALSPPPASQTNLCQRVCTAAPPCLIPPTSPASVDRRARRPSRPPFCRQARLPSTPPSTAYVLGHPHPWTLDLGKTGCGCSTGPWVADLGGIHLFLRPGKAKGGRALQGWGWRRPSLLPSPASGAAPSSSPTRPRFFSG
jgi:hypothetical protein